MSISRLSSKNHSIEELKNQRHITFGQRALPCMAETAFLTPERCIKPLYLDLNAGFSMDFY